MPRLLQAFALACAALACIALIWAPIVQHVPLVAAALGWALLILVVMAVTRPTLQRQARAWGAACLALALSGCGTLLGAGLPDAEKAPVTKQFMENYAERCKGHFWGNVGMGGTTGFDINCAPPQDDKTIDAIVAAVLAKIEAAAAATAPAASPK